VISFSSTAAHAYSRYDIFYKILTWTTMTSLLVGIVVIYFSHLSLGKPELGFFAGEPIWQGMGWLSLSGQHYSVAWEVRIKHKTSNPKFNVQCGYTILLERNTNLNFTPSLVMEGGRRHRLYYSIFIERSTSSGAKNLKMWSDHFKTLRPHIKVPKYTWYAFTHDTI